jgi:uncharacterized circularly permuted ATP-grasp superfamily protein
MDARLRAAARHSRRVYRPDGAPRPVWSNFFDAFAALSPAEIERRFASADRHLREAGVTYRAPGDTADRLWPLSHLPLLIDDADWRQLTAGIAQRAELFELLLRDLYGEGRLVTGGAIPAAAIAGSSVFARRQRRQAAGRALPPPLCRRCRARSGWQVVGLERPHPGAVGAGVRWKTAWCCRGPLRGSTSR